MLIISQNNSNFESFCVNFESKKSKNANEINEMTIKANFVEFLKISQIDFDAKIEKNKLLFCLRKNAIVKVISNSCKKINFD